MFKHIVFMTILFFSGYLYWTERPVIHGPGIVAPEAPKQQPAFGVNNFEYKDYDMRPLAEFEAEARILSKQRYVSDRLSDVAPVDIFLGWGPMSDERVLDELLITQSDRYFHWEMTSRPIPLHKMVSSTANVHLIASSDEIQKNIDLTRRGHIVQLKGYLVKIKGDDDWSKKSSLSRNDYGSGASEILWVKEFKIKNQTP